jgi:hypothetical protein
MRFNIIILSLLFLLSACKITTPAPPPPSTNNSQGPKTQKTNNNDQHKNEGSTGSHKTNNNDQPTKEEETAKELKTAETKIKENFQSNKSAEAMLKTVNELSKEALLKARNEKGQTAADLLVFQSEAEPILLGQLPALDALFDKAPELFGQDKDGKTISDRIPLGRVKSFSGESLQRIAELQSQAGVPADHPGYEAIYEQIIKAVLVDKTATGLSRIDMMDLGIVKGLLKGNATAEEKTKQFWSVMNRIGKRRKTKDYEKGTDVQPLLVVKMLELAEIVKAGEVDVWRKIQAKTPSKNLEGYLFEMFLSPLMIIREARDKTPKINNNIASLFETPDKWGLNLKEISISESSISKSIFDPVIKHGDKHINLPAYLAKLSLYAEDREVSAATARYLSLIKLNELADAQQKSDFGYSLTNLRNASAYNAKNEDDDILKFLDSMIPRNKEPSFANLNELLGKKSLADKVVLSELDLTFRAKNGASLKDMVMTNKKLRELNSNHSDEIKAFLYAFGLRDILLDDWRLPWINNDDIWEHVKILAEQLLDLPTSFNEKLSDLVLRIIDEYWEKQKNNNKFVENHKAIITYLLTPYINNTIHTIENLDDIDQELENNKIFQVIKNQWSTEQMDTLKNLKERLVQEVKRHEFLLRLVDPAVSENV